MNKKLFGAILILIFVLSLTASLTACENKAEKVTTESYSDVASGEVCVYNARAISSAIQSYCISNGKLPAPGGDKFTVTPSNGVGIVSGNGNIGTAADITKLFNPVPACIGNGTYTITVTGSGTDINVEVVCSIHG